MAPVLDALAEALGRELEAGLSAREKLQLRTILLKVIANLSPSSQPMPGPGAQLAAGTENAETPAP